MSSIAWRLVAPYLFAYIAISMCLPYHPGSTSPQSRSDAEVIGDTKAAEEFPAHLSSSEESTGSWSQLANDEDNPDDTSSYLQLSERSLRYPPCVSSLYSVVYPPSPPCISRERQQLHIYSEYCRECLMADFISLFFNNGKKITHILIFSQVFLLLVSSLVQTKKKPPGTTEMSQSYSKNAIG